MKELALVIMFSLGIIVGLAIPGISSWLAPPKPAVAIDAFTSEYLFGEDPAGDARILGVDSNGRMLVKCEIDDDNR